MLSTTGVASSDVIVPMVIGLVHPTSVVDIGCGTGAWLSGFKDRGVASVRGVDGTQFDRKTLLIAPDEFIAHDLVMPLAIGRRFDLVISLEVAEHLPPARAATFVAELCGFGDVILFSAAIPCQGGKNHIHEQWPDYWAALFKTHGYIPVDCLRERIWSDPSVLWWYAQNLMFFVRETSLDRYPALKSLRKPGDKVPRLIHPDLWDKKVVIPRIKKARLWSWFRR